MENNKICDNCGKSSDINSKFCTNCGNQFVQNEIKTNDENMNNQTNHDNNSKANLFGIISLVLYFAGPTLLISISDFLPPAISNKISAIGGLFPLIGIVVMIIGRIKYPTNKLLIIIMWVFIGSIILSLIFFLLAVLLCYASCVSIMNYEA